MKKLSSLMKAQNIMIAAAVAALLMIIFSLLLFKSQVNSYIDRDMRSQMDVIQNSSMQLIQNELKYLTRITASAAQLISQADIRTDEELVQTLKEYAQNSDIVRALFVTLDGHAYTSYAGYLGQNDKDTSIDGIALSDINATMFSHPYYSEEVGEIIFGVISPVTMAGKRGVLVSSYNTSQLKDLLKNEFVGGSVGIGIINSKGEVILGKSKEEQQMQIFGLLAQAKFSCSSAEEMQKNFEDGASGFSSYYSYGEERYCSYAPLGINDWYVVTLVPKASLHSNLIQLEKYGVQLAFEVAAIMLVMLAVIIAAWHREQKKIQCVLRRAAMLDGLTGIYNRSTAEKEIAQFMEGSGESAASALVVIDIDNFKLLNDTYGHIFGDSVLRECAMLLKVVFEEGGIIGRMGGDEFAVFIKQYLDEEQVKAKLHYFINHFYATTPAGEKKRISVSIGLAIPEPGENSFVDMYKQADDAMYRAKQNGKSRLSR